MSTLRDAMAYSTHRRLTYNNNKTANITSTECYTDCKKSDKSVFLINVLNLATELGRLRWHFLAPELIIKIDCLFNIREHSADMEVSPTALM